MFVGGKSAILTALCVAFGCRARGTQRASTLKDFIKTGCRLVALDLLLRRIAQIIASICPTTLASFTLDFY